MSFKIVARLASLAFACVAAVTWSLALSPPAHADLTCTFDASSGALDVDVTTGSEVVTLQRNGSDIEVLDGFSDDVPPVPPEDCGVDTPTLTTTSSIQMDDTAPGQDTDFNIEFGAGPFEPGTGGPSEGGGTSEIEITIDAGDHGADGDELTLLGGAGSEDWRFGALAGGASGVNLNAPEAGGPDGDDITTSGVEDYQVFTDPVLGGVGGNDSVIANGTGEFTGPFALPAQLTGGLGDDVLTAGLGNTYLGGDADDDTMTGGPGNDRLRVSFGAGGDDVAAGGGGTDQCTYFNEGGNVTADLRITTQQNTGGSGLDTLSGCENLEGGNGNDILTGTGGPNAIAGRGGADTLIGLAGNDTLIGDQGADALNVRDGGPDTASCGDPTPGPPPDTVTADQQGVDAINADCEQISFLATPPPPSPPVPPTGEDTTAPGTTIDKGPRKKTRKRRATFEFSSNEPGSTFECQLDKKPFASCESPFEKKVKRRRHSFQVRATDQAGNTDQTPALHKWKVKKKRR